MRTIALFGLALWLSGCALAVQARGPVSVGADGRPVITGTNGKSRPLTVPTRSPLRHLDGQLVELEGILRKGAIEVTTFDIEEGRSGLPAYTGRVRIDGEGYVWLDDGQTGAMYRMDGGLEDDVAALVGQDALVEGVVVGAMAIRPMVVVSLQ